MYIYLYVLIFYISVHPPYPLRCIRVFSPIMTSKSGEICQRRALFLTKNVKSLLTFNLCNYDNMLKYNQKILLIDAKLLFCTIFACHN